MAAAKPAIPLSAPLNHATSLAIAFIFERLSLSYKRLHQPA